MSGFSATIRARPLPSIGITWYFPASTYQVAIIAISLSRCSAATLWFSAKSSATWYSSQPFASSSESVSAEIGLPNPVPASVNDGPGQGQTARQPSWSIARWPIISKYWVWWCVSAPGSSRVWAKLTPWSGLWVTPLMVAGGSMPRRSSTVGTMSMRCAYCGRISPLLGMPFGQETMNGSHDAAAVGLALPAPERGVAGPRPAPRVVVEVLRAADLVDLLRGSPRAAPARC